MNIYIGVKKVKAAEMQKDGLAGYEVEYSDGYKSWCPKETFEKHNIKLHGEDGTKIVEEDVESFIHSYVVSKLGDKTTAVMAKLANGFDTTETSSCVDPKNYDEDLGSEICLKRIKDKVWMLLGFLLQSSNGFKS